MEISFADFAAAKHEKAVWDYFWKATDIKGHPYHKMAVCEKMSRKRFVKLLMATGLFERDNANKKADRVREACGCYEAWWYKNAPHAIWRISSRIPAEERLLRAIFGPGYKPEKPIKKKPVDRSKYESETRKEYEEFLKLLEKYPNCVDRYSCKLERDKAFRDAIELTGEVDEDGNSVGVIREGKAEELYKKLEEIGKISSYFAYEVKIEGGKKYVGR